MSDIHMPISSLARDMPVVKMYYPTTINESDNPDHYKTGKLECIDAMRAMLGDEGFAAYIRGTIFRYNWRLGRKDAPEMEAKKIAVYTRWLNDVLAGEELSK